MRNFINIKKIISLLEADEIVPTGGKNVTTRGNRAVSSVRATDLKPAGGDVTRRRATGARMNHPGAGAAFSSMMDSGEDEISDDEAARNAAIEHDRPLAIGHVTNENLPTVINNDIVEAGGVAPEWHQIKHLPTYMINSIRAGARKVFAEFTSTPIEDIQMICTFMNPENDVRTVMSWVKSHGELADTAEMLFGGGIPATVHKYITPDMTFLFVSDFMGKYVYAWVTDKKIGRERLQISQDK